MSDKEGEPGGKTADEGFDPAGFVVAQMQAGADQETIVSRLVERGADPAEARHIVDAVYPEVMRAAEAELFEPRALVPAVLAGIAAAVVGGIVWALIVVKTGYEISFTRYFYKPKQLRTLAEIEADIRALEVETEGLLEDILVVVDA